MSRFSLLHQAGDVAVGHRDRGAVAAVAVQPGELADDPLQDGVRLRCLLARRLLRGNLLSAQPAVLGHQLPEFLPGARVLVEPGHDLFVAVIEGLPLLRDRVGLRRTPGLDGLPEQRQLALVARLVLAVDVGHGLQGLAQLQRFVEAVAPLLAGLAGWLGTRGRLGAGGLLLGGLGFPAAFSLVPAVSVGLRARLKSRLGAAGLRVGLHGSTPSPSVSRCASPLPAGSETKTIRIIPSASRMSRSNEPRTSRTLSSRTSVRLRTRPR
jgi:hypothetical protein